MTVQASQASLCILTLCTVNLVYAYNVMYYVESTVNVVYVLYDICTVMHTISDTMTLYSHAQVIFSVFATFHR